MDDKELFESALDDQPVVEEVAAEAVAEPTNDDGQARDEAGRFAAKAEKVEPVAETQPAATAPKEEAHIPSWRLREEREARETAERRFNESQVQWQRQFAELQAKLPKQEPPAAPDVWEDPNGFVQHGVQQAVSPIQSEIAKLREEFSMKWAVKEHGQEKINAAYAALDRAAKSGNPEAQAAAERVKKSNDPYGDLVTWHEKQSVFEQIGNDPNAWFEKQLEERMKDPAFQASMLGKSQQAIRQPGAPVQNTIRLPPSLNRIAASAGNEDGAADMSDAGLFAHAMR